ncbi:MAG TPA: hypothetical protein VMJ34_07165 [Bryobacteraceae bacterium]|nr:hypothetical protein [Bryobacteraceae bacterium]
MPAEPHRKTPDELLRELEAEERQITRGRLKIFLGYASGVGKSYRMFDEARRRRERGQDVVVAGVQRDMPADVAELLTHLQLIPQNGDAIDLNAVLRRHPGVCLIDGLAYDNPPNFRNPTRWQDVDEILQAGISVIASINIQYVAGMSERAAPTVPVAFLQSADEIEIVDAPPDETRDRARQERLSRLRELALVLAADVVDHQLTEYLHRKGIAQHYGANERVMVCITPRANVSEMIATARSIADKFHGELIGAYVHQPHLSAGDQAALDEKLELAREAGASIEILYGENPVDAILQFARTRGITQLFIGHSQRSGLWSRLWGNPVDKLIYRSRGMDVRVFPQ